MYLCFFVLVNILYFLSCLFAFTLSNQLLTLILYHSSQLLQFMLTLTHHIFILDAILILGKLIKSESLPTNELNFNTIFTNSTICVDFRYKILDLMKLSVDKIGSMVGKV